MNIKEFKQFVKAVFHLQQKTGIRFSIEGRAISGIGKSESMPQVCRELSAEMGEPVGCLQEFLSTRDQPDVAGFGLPSKDVDGTHIMVRTLAPWMPRAGSPRFGIIVLDEFPQAPNEVKKPAAELLLNGAVGESRLDIGWMVIALGNRMEDRSGVYKDMAFIENRRCLINITAQMEPWAEWAEQNGIHPMAIAFAKFKPGSVFPEKVPDKPGPFATPRTLVKLSYMIDVLPEKLLLEAAMGYMGEGSGAEFMSFLRVYSEIVTFEEIVKDPMNVKVPTKMDACYATMQMLAHRVSPQTAQQAFKYLRRMTPEFQIAGLQASLRKSPDMVHSPEFRNWLQEPGVMDLVKNAAMAINK